ncbi:Hypothetical protein ABZS17D1_02525 [Kosakonia cowanii]
MAPFFIACICICRPDKATPPSGKTAMPDGANVYPAYS